MRVRLTDVGSAIYRGTYSPVQMDIHGHLWLTWAVASQRPRRLPWSHRQFPEIEDTQPGPASHDDDDLASGIPLLEVPDGRRSLAQRERPVDGRHDLP